LKTKKILLISLIICYCIQLGFSCSCDWFYFCDYTANNSDVKISIKGKVIDRKEYSLDNRAVYIEVLSVFRDDVGITDTIKLYGPADEGGGCEVPVYALYSVGKEYYISIGLEFFGNPISDFVDDPDYLVEGYWGFRPFRCAMNNLRIRDGLVKGAITEEIWEYPEAIFEESLENCDFILDPAQDDNQDAVINIFPNPVKNEMVTIEGRKSIIPISEINIYSIDGKLIMSNSSVNSFKTSFSIDYVGLVIVELIIDGSKYYEKIIVEG